MLLVLVGSLLVLLQPTAVAADESNPTPIAATTAAPLSVLGVGDCIMLGATTALEAAIPGIEVDAAVSRQASTGIGILRARAAAGQLPEEVIFHLGTNGLLTPGQFDEVMDALAGVRRVIFVNLTVPRSWEEPNNTILADGVRRYPNAVLVDWHAASAGRFDLLWDDGIHLRPAGADAYAALIAQSATAPLTATADGG